MKTKRMINELLKRKAIARKQSSCDEYGVVSNIEKTLKELYKINKIQDLLNEKYNGLIIDTIDEDEDNGARFYKFRLITKDLKYVTFERIHFYDFDRLNAKQIFEVLIEDEYIDDNTSNRNYKKFRELVISAYDNIKDKTNEEDNILSIIKNIK